MQLPPIPQAPHSKKVRFRLVLIGILAVVLVVLGICFPAELAAIVREISPGCWFRKLTGLACPGCGGTRAVGALLRGDVAAAFRHNLLLPISLLVLLAEYIRLIRVHFGHKPDWRDNRIYVRLMVIFAWVTLVWAILRNILGI